MCESERRPEFAWSFPNIPSHSYMFMLEAMTYKVAVRLPQGALPRDVEVEAWTSQCDPQHAQGNWHAKDLEPCDTQGDLQVYGQSVLITSAKDFGFTFRLRMRGSDTWQWVSGFQEDGTAHVEPPNIEDRWTQGVDYTHIWGGLHLGNFLAAVNAPKPDCCFTHVLNVADNLDMVYPVESSVDYHKVPMPDGAHNALPAPGLQEAVDWLLKNDTAGNKLLVNCRAGIGRAGSVAVGFVYASNPDWTFQQAYDFVYERRFVYPHAFLMEQLENLYPREPVVVTQGSSPS